MDYPDDNYTDEEEYQDNVVDGIREVQEAQADEYGNYPAAKKSESLFSLFGDTWKATDSSKVANLEKEELGSLNISVRDCQRIALMAKTLHHPKFADYFKAQGEITLATSMSRKGWFVEMFVTSKKFAQKGTTGNLINQPQQQKSKWRIFGKNNQQPVGQS